MARALAAKAISGSSSSLASPKSPDRAQRVQGRAAARLFRARRRQLRQRQADGLKMRGVADAEVGAALRSRGQLDLAALRREHR